MIIAVRFRFIFGGDGSCCVAVCSRGDGPSFIRIQHWIITRIKVNRSMIYRAPQSTKTIPVGVHVGPTIISYIAHSTRRPRTLQYLTKSALSRRMPGSYCAFLVERIGMCSSQSSTSDACFDSVDAPTRVLLLRALSLLVLNSHCSAESEDTWEPCILVV